MIIEPNSLFVGNHKLVANLLVIYRRIYCHLTKLLLLKIMKSFKLLFILAAIFWLSACNKDLNLDPLNPALETNTNVLKSKSLQLKIAVVSDIHYLDPSLMQNNAANGIAFQSYLAADPKLIEFSGPIFKEVISELLNEKPDIVLIPGDLTKDGEKVSHKAMAEFLKQLSRRSIQVFVIPGNHDVKNPEALAFNGDNAYPVSSVTADEFSKIYADYGYKKAVSRDPNSLSYIYKPAKDLWILGIDDCEYYNNTTSAIVAGTIKPETMSWIQENMIKAKAENITVLAMMHHGIMEHYTGQNAIDPGYVTDNWEANADALMNAGLKVMFTGHYHANDITVRSSGEKYLFDIETGSLVNPPSPFRIVTLTGKDLDIDTELVTSIHSSLPGGVSFTSYSNSFMTSHLDGYFTVALQLKFGIDQVTAVSLAPRFRNAVMAHYAGDENISPGEQVLVNQVYSLNPQLGGILQSFWTDLTPEDNNIHITLN